MRTGYRFSRLDMDGSKYSQSMGNVCLEIIHNGWHLLANSTSLLALWMGSKPI